MGRGSFDVAWLVEVARRREAGEPCDRELGELLRAVRPAAQAAIRRTQQRLGRRGTPDADVDDILQNAFDSFIAAIRPQTYRGGSPRRLLCVIAARCTIAFYRPAHRRRELSEASLVDDDGESPLDTLAAPSTPADEHERQLIMRRLRRALAALYKAAPDQAAAVDLYHFQQVGSAATCASHLGVNVTRFHQWVSRGCKKLERLFVLMEEDLP